MLSQITLTNKPTVGLYLALYEAAPRELYLDYFKDFKLLINWLGLPQGHEYTKAVRLPRLLVSYEIQEIAKLLEVSQYELFSNSFLQIKLKNEGKAESQEN